jgi:hypothetical protein
MLPDHPEKKYFLTSGVVENVFSDHQKHGLKKDVF